MRVLLTGGNGMLARSIESAWDAGNHELVPVTRADADLTDAAATRALFEKVRPDAVIHTAARVGGIAANIANPTGFLMDNLLIDTSVLNAAVAVGAENFIYAGSSCMYPRDHRQPLVESDVLAAPLEPTNEGYAISKIAAAKYCEYVLRERGWNYKVIIPSNLYGPDDNYSLSSGHLVGAALAKVHAAKEAGAATVDVWGDGTARREFTFVGDLATWIAGNIDASAEWPAMLNVGYGADFSVLEFYEFAREVVGYDVEFVLDSSKPAGMHQKLMDSSMATTDHGWKPTTHPRQGMATAYDRYLTTLS